MAWRKVMRLGLPTALLMEPPMATQWVSRMELQSAWQRGMLLGWPMVQPKVLQKGTLLVLL